jgi:hypothetical protein
VADSTVSALGIAREHENHFHHRAILTSYGVTGITIPTILVAIVP